MAAAYKGVLKHCNSYGLRQKLNDIYKEAMEKPHSTESGAMRPAPGKEEI